MCSKLIRRDNQRAGGPAGRTVLSCVGLSIAAALAVTGCGAGSGQGSGSASPTSGPVAGAVRTPGGHVALDLRQRIELQVASLIVAPAQAEIAGLAVVPDGTSVELDRIDPVSGAVISVLATTRTTAGQYSFDLTALGVDYSTTLLVRLAPATQVQMRAFVTSAASDVDPGSEAAVQYVLSAIGGQAGQSLANITVQELDDFLSGADMVLSAGAVAAQATTAATVSAGLTALQANAALGTYLQSRLVAGHATGAGLGDVAGFFPLATGDTWSYAASADGAAPATFVTAVAGANAAINGTSTVPVTDVEYQYPPPSSGSPVRTATAAATTSYALLGSGVWNFSDPGAGLPPAVYPYEELALPARRGHSVTTVDAAASFSAGRDYDGDGIIDTATSMTIDNDAVGYETVTVDAGTFRTLHIDERIHLMVALSASRGVLDMTDLRSWYLAPGIGPVRLIDNMTTTSPGVSQQTSRTRDLFAAQVGAVTLQSQRPAATSVQAVPLLHNDLVFDGSRDVFYASVPGAAQNGNSVVSIDARTGAILRSLAVGSEPNRLALSADNQFLYVALDGTGAVARIALTTFTSDEQFSLGTDARGAQLYARSLAALPNLAGSVIVSRVVRNASPNYAGIAIYDGTVKRGAEAPGGVNAAHEIALAGDGLSAYGLSFQSSPAALSGFSITTAGIALVNQAFNSDVGSDRLTWAGGRLYSSGGAVYDAQRLAVTGSLPGAFSAANGHCIPDLAKGRIYCQSPGSVAGVAVQITAYDAASLAGTATLDTGRQNATVYGNLVRFGAHGIAVNVSSNAAAPQEDTILLIQTPVVP